MKKSALFCVTLALSILSQTTQAQERYDVVIEGGRIVDGTGNAWYLGDLGIRGDRIARITRAGVLSAVTAGQRIDAQGLVVAPGFIDIQSHSRDAFLLGDGRVVSKVTQGITTEILGEGWTNAPANERTLSAGRAVDPSSATGREFFGTRGFDAWLEAMEHHGVSPNIGSFVGAATVRVYAKGEAMGPATAAELDTMRAITRSAMEDGAFGVASALIYPPGNFASADELVEIAEVIAPYGGLYITHMRSEADRVLEAMDEAIEIGRRAGVPVEIYHLKAAGQRNWHKAPLMISKIDSARAAGLDVQANMYPYVAGGTGLAALLPPWASADGSLLSNIRDPETRVRIHSEVLRDQTDWENLGLLSTPQGVLLTGIEGEENQQWVGMRLSEIAARMDKDWVEATFELLSASEGQAGMVVFMMNEDNVKLQLQQPWIKIGTDAGGFDPDSAMGMTHPRAYGTYPRILGRYVREERTLTLEDAVRKTTSAVRWRMQYARRPPPWPRGWEYKIAACCWKGCLPTSSFSTRTPSPMRRRLSSPISSLLACTTCS
jgi:dihydroorotase/N-acyl-D-amino-acid deacylase